MCSPGHTKKGKVSSHIKMLFLPPDPSGEGPYHCANEFLTAASIINTLIKM